MTISVFRTAKDFDMGIILYHQYLTNAIPERPNILGTNIITSGIFELLGDISFCVPAAAAR